jgi:hypothetical protein
MTEFSISDISFKGGTAKAREFFNALFKKISMWNIQDIFFREYYRSGSVFLLRLDSLIDEAFITKLTQTYGLEQSTAALRLPVKYVVLNPAEIEASGNISFVNTLYNKILSEYELSRLRKPVTDEDLEVFKSLPPEIQKQIKKGGTVNMSMPLDPNKTYAVFYKKQSYEPFAIPMGYPVLADLNWKAEMRKMDMAVTRTVQQAVLLITMGAPPDEGGTNVAAMVEMQKLFQNESVGRVLIADWTTKAQFIIPDISNFLDPKKYESVDRDIRMGLNNVLMGDGEKFANQSMKVQVFIERLKQGRQAFLYDFLIPEIKRISKDMGFKSFPTPYFADINLKDSLEYAKLYTRLAEIGLLTAEETIEAIETGILPDNISSLESQTAFKQARDKGLYQPIAGGPADQMAMAKYKVDNAPKPKISGANGRPKGTKSKQSTKKVRPMGATYSVMKVKDNFWAAQKAEDEIKKILLKKFKTKELDDNQNKIARNIASVLISNEEPKDWLDKVKSYVEKPVDTNPERVDAIADVAEEHQLDGYLASILFASQIDAKE